MSKGETTRQRIIAQAAPLFNQRGYKGCSLNDIMEVTGLEKGGIYRHFSSKEELAAEAFDFAWATTFTRRTQGLDEIPNQVDRLKEYISRYVYRSGLPGGCPLLNTAIDSDDGNLVLRERVQKALRDWKTMLVRILKDGIAAGTVSAEVVPEEVANLIISTLEGSVVLSRIERNDDAMRSARERLTVFLESRIRNKQQTPAKAASRPSKKIHRKK